MIKFKNILEEGKRKKVETLYHNEWLSLKKVTLPLEGYTGYTYSHETRCDGKIIAVLLYRRTGKDSWEYGIRHEITPAWGSKPQLSALTGGVDEGEEPIDSAVREVKEESGYRVKKEDLENLGTCFGTKSTDTIYYLYAVDVGDKKPGKVSGDGSQNEKEASMKWMYYNKSIKCPILSTMILRKGLE